jgi:hypothetical protein
VLASISMVLTQLWSKAHSRKQGLDATGLRPSGALVDHIETAWPEYNRLYAHPFQWTWTDDISIARAFIRTRTTAGLLFIPSFNILID